MTNTLTVDYLMQHQRPDTAHFTEVGVLLSNAVMSDAIADLHANGPQPAVELTYKVRVEQNVAAGCTTVTWTRADGSTLSYHRPK